MARNPVLWLELRIRSSEKRLWILALFGMLVMAAVTGLVMASFFAEQIYRRADLSNVGTGLVWACLGCHAALMILLAPLAGAGRISSEREQRTLPALLNSSLTPLQILWGKLVGCWLFVIWLGVTALPFLAVGAMWGGPPLAMVAAGFAFNTFAGLTLATLALGLSGWFGRSLTSYLTTGAVLIGWLVVFPMLGGLLTVLDHWLNWKQTGLVSYISYYHLPFTPLIVLGTADWDLHRADVLQQLGFALAAWTGLSVVGIILAHRGLKREVY